MPDAQPYVLATSCAQPDREFHTLAAMARAIVAARDDIPGAPELVLTPSVITRGALPGGACVTVRTRQAGEEGKGAFMAFALIPRHYGDAAAKLLMVAILAVAQPEPA